MRSTQGLSIGSVTAMSPATQPSSAAPSVMMTGKRSISTSSMRLANTTSGIEIARPMTSSTVLPLAAAATAITLSRLITRSASRIVLIAAAKLVPVASPPCPSSSGISNWTAIHSSSAAPTSLR